MTAIFLEWLAHCNQRSARRLLGASAMREFLAAATIAVVFVGGAFLIPASYERPVSPSAPRSLDASVPAAVPPLRLRKTIRPHRRPRGLLLRRSELRQHPPRPIVSMHQQRHRQPRRETALRLGRRGNVQA